MFEFAHEVISVDSVMAANDQTGNHEHVTWRGTCLLRINIHPQIALSLMVADFVAKVFDGVLVRRLAEHA